MQIQTAAILTDDGDAQFFAAETTALLFRAVYEAIVVPEIANLPTRTEGEVLGAVQGGDWAGACEAYFAFRNDDGGAHPCRLVTGSATVALATTPETLRPRAGM